MRHQVSTIRAFNRFWTKAIGVLEAGLLDSPYSLTEVRVIFEVAQRDGISLTEVRKILRIDSGYLSRILTRLKQEGVVAAAPSGTDGRRQVLTLRSKGHDLFRELDGRASEEIQTMLSPLGQEDRERLVGAMNTIRRIIDDQPPSGPPFVLRPLAPGDLGWVLARHGVLYAQERGFDEEFEALVAQIVAGYAKHHDPRRETGWIAEVDGEAVGSIFCMKKSNRVAQLRLLLVEPRARRMGIGTKLVEECVKFARRARYKQMMLWTKDVLHDARRIYERAGFELLDEDDRSDGTKKPRGQNWWLNL
jgi:DNA-binding MarR family transcriptional regulator/predicted N-acetyltransferase YhbS